MNVQFATCDPIRAFEYLKKVYPNVDLKEEMVGKLLSLVGADILRVQDPFMHGNKIAVVAGNSYKPENKEAIDEAIAQMKENKLI